MHAILSAHRRWLGHELADTLRLAAPLVLGQLSAIGMNLIDTLLAGHLNAHTLGAVALGSNVWTLAIICIIGVMMCLQPSVAQLHGAGRDAHIAPLFRQALWLALPLGIGLGFATALFGPLLFGLIGVDASLVEDASRFLRAIAWGAPALAVFFCLRGLSEGMGLTRPTMYFSMLGLALLGPLGYVLMYGAFGFPQLGAFGCGLATAIVLWVQCLSFAWYVVRRKRYRDLHLFARFDRPSPRALVELLGIGVPIAVTLLMEAGLFVAVALTIGKLGADVIASHQIAMNVASVVFMVPLGIALATTVRVGFARGRNSGQDVRRAAAAGLLLTLVMQVVSACIMFAFARHIASLYTTDVAVIVLAAQLLTLGRHLPAFRRHAGGCQWRAARPQGHALADAVVRTGLLGRGHAGGSLARLPAWPWRARHVDRSHRRSECCRHPAVGALLGHGNEAAHRVHAKRSMRARTPWARLSAGRACVASSLFSEMDTESCPKPNLA
jgi:MATE family multidrug resistance protein